MDDGDILMKLVFQIKMMRLNCIISKDVDLDTVLQGVHIT